MPNLTGPHLIIILVIVLLLFAAGFMWMRRLSVFELPARFLFQADPETVGGASR